MDAHVKTTKDLHKDMKHYHEQNSVEIMKGYIYMAVDLSFTKFALPTGILLTGYSQQEESETEFITVKDHRDYSEPELEDSLMLEEGSGEDGDRGQEDS